MTASGSSYFVVRTSPDPLSQAGKRVLNDVKAVPAPWRVLITGAAAENADSLHALGAKLPLAIGLIALTTFCVLFLFTGSVVLPIKALVLNTLSLSTAFGALVWIFQDGHLMSIYGSTVTGILVPTMPILMFCLSFGMSMDYEVFLLSRIREEWLLSGRTPSDNVRAVTLGLGRTGRLVTAAAALMAIVFASLATGKVSFMQLFGTGLTLAADTRAIDCYVEKFATGVSLTTAGAQARGVLSSLATTAFSLGAANTIVEATSSRSLVMRSRTIGSNTTPISAPAPRQPRRTP